MVNDESVRTCQGLEMVETRFRNSQLKPRRFFQKNGSIPICEKMFVQVEAETIGENCTAGN